MRKEIKVIYLHGYGSSSASGKVAGLREYFWDVYAPDIPNCLLVMSLETPQLKHYLHRPRINGEYQAKLVVGQPSKHIEQT
jgi:predicted esterase YcpF (UPF0227 family)